MQRIIECDPVTQSMLLSNTLLKSTHLKANMNDNLLVKVANFISHCSFHAAQVIIVTKVQISYKSTFVFSVSLCYWVSVSPKGF